MVPTVKVAVVNDTSAADNEANQYFSQYAPPSDEEDDVNGALNTSGSATIEYDYDPNVSTSGDLTE